MDLLHPAGSGIVPPADVNKEKRKFLRSRANFAGLMMLVLVVSFQLTFPLVVFFLSAMGMVSGEMIQQACLGLDNTTYMLIYSFVYIAAMGAPLLLLLSRQGFNPLAPAKRVHAGVGALGYLGAVGICMLANVITSILLSILSDYGIEAAPAPQLMENTPISFVLNLVVLAVLPALLEELVFRGCVLRLLRPYGDWFAVVISAVLFGLMHGNLRQIPFAIIVGLVLGWLYVVTENIWLPMLVHFTNNAISVVAEYLSFSLSSDASASLYSMVIVRLIGVGLVAVALLLGCYWRRLKLRKSGTGLGFGNRLFSLFTAPALMGSVALFILLMLLEM